MTDITASNATEILSRYLLPDVIPIIVDLEKSVGNRIVDAASGRSFLDCFSYVASNPIGHNHPGLAEPAFERTLLRVAKTKPSHSDFFTVEMASFVDTFVRVAIPAEFQHLFFIQGGAAAVENALKTAFDWKVRLNRNRGKSDSLGTQVIYFQDAFHGRTGYALSLTNTADPRKTKFFPRFEWPRITNPKIQFPCAGEHLEAVIREEERAVAEIKKVFEENPDDIAAIIIEPIQGEGGDNHFRPEFHQALRSLANQYEAMLVYDEIQSGIGLTGKMWAYQHYGITPDIICFGKKAQVCGIAVGRRVDEVEKNVFVEASRINSTWGGNLTDMVRSQRYLEVIEEDRLVENAAVVGVALQRVLVELAEKHQGLLSNGRGQGLMCAIDVVTPGKRDNFWQGCFDRGALLLKCGRNAIRFRPSLTFSREDVSELAPILEEVAKALA